jgi:hypothetical protein
MTTITLFAGSLLVSIYLVIAKAVEIKYGKKCVSLKLLSLLDPHSQNLISGLKFRMLQIVQSVQYIILVQIRAVFINLLEKVEDKIMEEYRAKHSVLAMGRKNIVNKGSVSFYLKKITENRREEMRGKIE